VINGGARSSIVFSASFAVKGHCESKAETRSEAETYCQIVRRHAQGRANARPQRDAQGQRLRKGPIRIVIDWVIWFHGDERIGRERELRRRQSIAIL
jgi:hypothetical protein